MLLDGFIGQLIGFAVTLAIFAGVVFFILRNNNKQFKAITDAISPLFAKIDAAVGPELDAIKKAAQDVLDKLNPPKPPTGV